MKQEIEQKDDRALEFRRLFNAPRALVFAVWTDPKHLANWWGPSGFTITTKAMDVRPGGVWEMTMHGPDGRDYPNLIQYTRVVRPELLVWNHGTGDDDYPYQFEVTVRFTEVGAKTEINMRMVFRSREARDYVVQNFGAIEGNKQTMDRLEGYLTALAT